MIVITSFPFSHVNMQAIFGRSLYKKVSFVVEDSCSQEFEDASIYKFRLFHSLECLASEAVTGQRFGRLIEILNLQALALQAHGKTSKALKLLQKSLARAEPEGYLRIFLDEHEPMHDLLSSYYRSGSSQHKSFVQKLLRGFTGRSPAIVSRTQSTDIVEPLTSREREVL